MKQHTISMLSAGTLLLSGFLIQGQEPPESVIEHSDCSFFAKRDKLHRAGVDSGTNQYRLSALTQQVTQMLSSAPAVKRVKSFEDPAKLGTIDKYLFADMQVNGVAPADKTNDFEFIRRVTLDLTGR